MLNNPIFYCKNKDTYPPFKNGLYLEEFFFETFKSNNPKLKRKYIPILWTNFQIDPNFGKNKTILQKDLDKWINENPADEYFIIVQYDDGPILTIPQNTIIYGACSGTIPIPLIYQDINNTLDNIPKKLFNNKTILCSFVGSITSNNIKPNVRETIIQKFSNNKNFLIKTTNSWTPDVDSNKQKQFIETTINSKFVLAPRGYGRSSFRFFEIFKLGSIPIYVWNDIEWLPYKDKIDYSKMCISININDIDNLETILNCITEKQYNDMINEYDKNKEFFTLDYLYKYIVDANTI